MAPHSDDGREFTLALQPGTRIAGGYEVLRTLAGGSTCALTYAARDNRTGVAVVIKEFLPRALVGRRADGSVRAHSFAEEQEFVRALRRFVHETELLRDVRHDSLVRVADVLEENGTAYAVMEHHEGESLEATLASSGGTLSTARSLDLMVRVLDALDLVHTEGIFHRGISPGAILVSPAGAPRLLGFSASRHVAGTRDLATPWMPLEQYGSRGLGPWTDVYACAAVLYRLITGTVPPTAADRAAGTALVPPASLAPELPAALSSLVLRALSPSAEQRPHGAGEFRRQLITTGGAQLHLTRTPATQYRAPAAPYQAPPAPPPVLADQATSAEPIDDGEEDLREAFDAAPPDEREPAPLLFVKYGEGGVILPAEEEPLGLSERFGAMATRLRQSWPRRAPRAPRAPRPRRRLAWVLGLLAVVTVGTASVLTLSLTPRSTLKANELARQRSAASTGERSRVPSAASSPLLVARSAPASAATDSVRRDSSSRTPALAPMQAGVSRPRIPSAPAVATRVNRPPQRTPTVLARVAPRAAAPETSSSTVPVAPPVDIGAIAIPTGSVDVRIAPPDLLLSLREQLNAGARQADDGDYASARRLFRQLETRTDSALGTYRMSPTLTKLRGEIGQADARARDACDAENDLLRRRGGRQKPCA